MHWIDIAIIAAFIVYAVSSGFRASGVASQNLEEYFLAGRSLKGWQAGLSMAATQFAADTPLLVTGLIATAGIFSLWRLWIYALAFLMLGFVLAASWRRAGVLTDAELTELRYGKKAAAALRGIKAIYFGTIFNCTVLAMVLFAATRIAEPFLHWNEWLPGSVYEPVVHLLQWLNLRFTIPPYDDLVWIKSANNLISIGGIVLVTLFYSTTGGLRSVVATDIAQLFLAMIATAVFAGYVVYEAGGMSALLADLRERFNEGGPGGILPDQILAFTPTQAKDASMVVMTVFALQWVLQINADGTGYLAQRTMACRSERDARYAAVVFTFVQVFFRSLFWLPIALGLLVIFPPQDLTLHIDVLKAQQEDSYVRGVAEFLPPGLKGLMLTGMLAALASTVDTHLNWGSSYWTNDIYKRFICQSWLKREPEPRSLVWVARMSNICILIIALVVMSQVSSIQEAWQNSLLLGSGIGVVLVLRWLWWRINAWGEIAAIASSLVLLPILLYGVENEAARLLLMATGATSIGIGVSLWMGPEDEEGLRAFYRRAKPMGFWGPIAAAEGDEADLGTRRLGRAMIAMLTAAFSIFCLLVGIGTWICDSPPPVWFPWQTPWVIVLIAVGIALTPVWYRLGFAEESWEGSHIEPFDSKLPVGEPSS
ncbi:MAG: sodium:solute symporter family protein [Gemmataceae bacterium]